MHICGSASDVSVDEVRHDIKFKFKFYFSKLIKKIRSDLTLLVKGDIGEPKEYN